MYIEFGPEAASQRDKKLSAFLCGRSKNVDSKKLGAADLYWEASLNLANRIAWNTDMADSHEPEKIAYLNRKIDDLMEERDEIFRRLGAVFFNLIYNDEGFRSGLEIRKSLIERGYIEADEYE